MFSLQFIRGAKDTGKTSSMSQSVSLMRRSLHSCKFKGITHVSIFIWLTRR